MKRLIAVALALILSAGAALAQTSVPIPNLSHKTTVADQDMFVIYKQSDPTGAKTGNIFAHDVATYMATKLAAIPSVLANGYTATTQAAADSSTLLATDAFVQNAVKFPPSSVFFGSGRPWVDVQSGANGCAAAVPGPLDAKSAIQCQLTYMYNTFGGGVVYFSPGPGNYNLYSGLTVKGDIQLRGVGVTTTNLVVNGDFTALTFDSTATWSSLSDMTVVGTNLISQPPTTNLVSVANGISVFFRNCELKGGFWALQTGGSDGDVRDCSIEGFGAAGGGVLSSGANTYYDAKIDENDTAVQAAFRQVAFYQGNVAAENRIVNSDTSGLYVHSLEINDTFNQAITSIVNTVIAQPVSITGAAQTMLANVEFGSSAFANVGVTTIIGSVGVGVTVVPTGGTIDCVAATNDHITCPGITVASGGTGLTTLTAHAVLLGEGTSNVAFAPTAIGGRVLTDQGAGADPQFATVSGDCGFSSGGVITCTKTNGTSFGALATVVPGANVATALASALNGSGAVSATTSPTFVTPILGVAAATSVTAANGVANGFILKDVEGTVGGSLSEGTGDNVFFTAGNGVTCSPLCQVAIRDSAANTEFSMTNNSATPTVATAYFSVLATTDATTTAAGGSSFAFAGGIGVAKKAIFGSAIVLSGSAPTGNTGACAASSFTGGTLAGKFSAAVCTASTIILSGLPTAPNGYTCDAQDQTTPSDTLKQTANTTTSVTWTATTVAADVIVYKCLAW